MIIDEIVKLGQSEAKILCGHKGYFEGFFGSAIAALKLGGIGRAYH